MERAKCKGEKNKGGPCTNYPQAGSEYCIFHDPSWDRYRRQEEASLKGGRTQRRNYLQKKLAELRESTIPDMPLETADDVRKFLATCMNDVRNGLIAKEDAQMAAYMAHVMLQAIKTTASAPPDASKVVPEITEIEGSSDPRATSDDYPGSELGTREEAN